MTHCWTNVRCVAGAWCPARFTVHVHTEIQWSQSGHIWKHCAGVFGDCLETRLSNNAPYGGWNKAKSGGSPCRFQTRCVNQFVKGAMKWHLQWIKWKRHCRICNEWKQWVPVDFCIHFFISLVFITNGIWQNTLIHFVERKRGNWIKSSRRWGVHQPGRTKRQQTAPEDQDDADWCNVYLFVPRAWFSTQLCLYGVTPLAMTCIG